jgi:hypothetical protein
LFQFAYQNKKILFTHAGVNHNWFVNDFKGCLDENIAKQLNNPTTEEQELFLHGCGTSHGGDMDYGGIFWADITDLYQPLKGFTQIDGHNRVDGVTEYRCSGGRIIFCDCLFNRQCFGIDDDFNDDDDWKDEDGDLSDVQKHTKPAVEFILAKWTNVVTNIEIVWIATGKRRENVFHILK